MKRIETIDVVTKTDVSNHESRWLHLLRNHIQEWKDHYSLEKQAVDELEAEHQHLLVQLDRLWSMKKKAMMDSQEQEVDTVQNHYQVRRELIRERQQAELAASLLRP